MKIQCLFIISFILLNSMQVKSRELSIIDTFEIFDIFQKMSLNPTGIIFNLIKARLRKSDTDFECSLCKNVVRAIRRTILDKFEKEGLKYYFELLCSIVYERDFCLGAVQKMGDTTFDNFIKRLGNELNLCHSLSFCEEGEETEDVYDYAKRLLKDKPKNKKREPIDTSAPQLRMMQVTDIHFDQHYLEGASTNCGYHLCCREPASQYSRLKAGKFGNTDGHCDTNREILNSFVQKAYELKPDFIIWTGDNMPHDLFNSDQEEVYNVTTQIRDTINDVFGNEIQVFPVLGNHEKYPNDQYGEDEHELLERMAEIYKEYFTEESAYESFRKYGHYTEKLNNTNLRIVVLNCLVCSSTNFILLGGNHTQAKEEFKWLESVLRSAEKDNEYVYIIDHFPINANFQLVECSKRLRALFDRFDYIIRGFFSGHTHMDDIAPVRAYFEPRPIINVNFIAPSLTTYRGINPSFRIYILDSNTKGVIDYEQYRFNVTHANEVGKIEWYISHKETELLNVTSLTELDKMFSLNVAGDYIKKRYSDAIDVEKKMFDKDEILKAQCVTQTDDFHDQYVCNEDGVFSMSFLYDLLNTFSGEWVKDK